MRTTSLPPHLAAQSIASQPTMRPQAPSRAQPQPQAPAQVRDESGFEALALKSANPTRIITGKPVEAPAAPQPTRSAQAPAPATPASAPAAAPMSAQEPAPARSALDELMRYTRPGSQLDIRV